MSDGGYYSPTVPGINSLIWPEATEGDQSVSVMVSEFGMGETIDTIALECRRTDAANKGNGLRAVVQHVHCYPSTGLPPACLAMGGREWYWWVVWDIGPGPSQGHIKLPVSGDTSLNAWPFGDPVMIRFESDADGAYRLSVNSTLIVADNAGTTFAGPSKVGVWASRDQPALYS